MTGSTGKKIETTSQSTSDPENQYDVPGTTAGFLLGANNGLTNLAPALVKAQSEMKNASLNKTNPHFKSRYADLAEIRDTVTPALTSNGLAVLQFTQLTSNGFFLVTRLLHKSGEFIDSRFPLPENVDKPQQMGSAITYARRYMLAAICGITAEEDDDGNAAQANTNGGGRALARPLAPAAAGTKPAASGAGKSGADGIFL